MNDKLKIIEIFNNRIKGKLPNTSNSNAAHDGKEGHWLEEQFGITHNASNTPDLFGYELKNQTSSKTTFGDWSANEYIFTDNKYAHIFNSNIQLENRDKFLKIFGKANLDKGGRHSWSGEPCPKINIYNSFGQKLVVTASGDIHAVYSFKNDTRPNKEVLIPKDLQGDIVLAKWYGSKKPIGSRHKTLKEKLEDKFNQKGWIVCKKDCHGRYHKICFGKPITFDNWIKLVKTGDVFFDSGMYEGNSRPYSQWRANNQLWDKLIEEEF